MLILLKLVKKSGSADAAIKQPPRLFRIEVATGAATELGSFPGSDSEGLLLPPEWEGDDGSVLAENSQDRYRVPTSGGNEMDKAGCTRHRAIDRKFKRRPSGGGSRHRSLDWQSGAAFTERPKRQRASAGVFLKERGGRCPRVVGAAIGRLVSSVVVKRFSAEVAYLDYDAAGGQHGLAIIKPDGSDSRLVVPSAKNTTLTPTAWSDDGTESFYSSLDTGWTIRRRKRANGLDA